MLKVTKRVRMWHWQNKRLKKDTKMVEEGNKIEIKFIKVKWKHYFKLSKNRGLNNMEFKNFGEITESALKLCERIIREITEDTLLD